MLSDYQIGVVLSVLRKHRGIVAVWVASNNNCIDESAKFTVHILLDSKDKIRGLLLWKIQAEISSAINRNVQLHELSELVYDEDTMYELESTKVCIYCKGVKRNNKSKGERG